MNTKTIRDVEPERIGTEAKAWRVDVEAVAAKRGFHDNSIGEWVIVSPYNPLFPYTAVIVTHLRPMPHHKGVPIDIYVPGATHQIIVASLPPYDTPNVNTQNKILSPVIFMGQFAAASDAEALARLDFTVGEIIEGKLIADPDALPLWVERYGDAMLLPELREALKRQPGLPVKNIFAVLFGAAAEASTRERENAGLKTDEWGATLGCSCLGCQHVRQEHGGPAIPSNVAPIPPSLQPCNRRQP